MPLSSAVLAVYNSERSVKQAIDSLLSQSVPVELIVVDDGSTDKTLSILKSYGRQIKLIEQSHAGPGVARNLGAKHAHRDILLFVDADMTFANNYAHDLIAPIKTNKVIGTYTTEERVANWDNTLARCWNYQEGWEDGKRFPKNPPKWGTDFRAINKFDFDRVGGFDNIGYTDTWSLFNKLATRPLATKAICYHRNPDNYVSVYRQARWAAKRPYKLGALGLVIALLRTSLPVSLAIGASKALAHRTLTFLPFKIVYDLGRFVGILEMVFTKKLSK